MHLGLPAVATLACLACLATSITAQAFVGLAPNGSLVMKPEDGQHVVLDGVVFRSLLDRLELLEQRLATLERLPGPKGDPGEKGDKGDPGSLGPCRITTSNVQRTADWATLGLGSLQSSWVTAGQQASTGFLWTGDCGGGSGCRVGLSVGLQCS